MRYNSFTLSLPLVWPLPDAACPSRLHFPAGSSSSAAAACMALSVVCGLLALTSLKRVKNLDKFEKEMRGK